MQRPPSNTHQALQRNATHSRGILRKLSSSPCAGACLRVALVALPLLSGCQLFLTANQEEGNCADALDNDSDGLVDCGDEECAAEVACLAECGDGLLTAGEECDDGNNGVATDGCVDGCQAAVLCDATRFNFGQGFAVDPRNGNCLVFSSAETTFNEGRAVCTNAGGESASVVDQEELDLVTDLVTGTEAWIGLSDEAEEGTFVWLDGAPFVFDSFNTGEPNNNPIDNPIAGEDCVISREDAVWIDISCDLNRFFLCKFLP